MAIHGNVTDPRQVWTETLTEAKEQAAKMSKRFGNATIIRSRAPEAEESKQPVYYVEADPGMIRIHEKVVETYKKGAKV